MRRLDGSPNNDRATRFGSAEERSQASQDPECSRHVLTLARPNPSAYLLVCDPMESLGVRLLSRFAHFTRIFNRSVGAFGWIDGVRSVRRYFRQDTSRLELSPASGVSPLVVRLGRGQSDFDTMIHVWREGAYDIGVRRDARWVVDAGANVGYASVWFVRQFPDAKIIAIEPDPANFAILVANTEAYPQIVCLDAALGGSDGTVGVFTAGAPDSTRTGAAGGDDLLPSVTVRSISISTLMSEFGIDTIDFLKIDIEGSELEVLKSSADWIDRVDVLGCELHDRFRPGCTRAWVSATEGFASELWRGENTFAFR